MYAAAVGDDYDRFEALRPDLIAFARTLLRGSRLRLEPDDLVQAVLTKLFAGLHGGGFTLAEIADPRAFALRAVKNQFLDEVRRFSHARELLARGREGDAPNLAAAGRADEPDMEPELRELLGKLDAGERCFIWRVVFEERSVEEAQRLCGWPPKSPFYHLRVLLARLATLMGEA
jgi:DNA-directed RNA polymerase specialized sigma24 family protein